MRASKIALLVAAALYSGTQAYASDTSSSIRGKVVDTSGNPKANVVVEVIYEPTNSIKRLTTNENGSFQARGLQVGGPYTIKLQDGSKLRAETIDDLFLQLSKTSSVNLVVQPDNVERIEVRGSVMMAGAYKTGSASEFSSDDINNTASISRDIKSVLQRDSKIMVDNTVDGGPALSIAGSNIRYNSLTVDGVRQNDDFGLNKSGYPGRRTPISLDAIEQISVNISPYDVTFGNFQGGNINVVTKSGSNEFHGSAFYTRSDDDLVGDESKGEDIDIGDFKEDTYGATFGGPIIQDKLFFFASWEKFESSAPYPFSLGNGDGTSSPNEIDKVSVADFERITQIAQDVYNFDPMGFDSSDDIEDEKKLLKLDWYINDDHRAQLTWQDNEGNTIRDFYTNPAVNRAASLSNRYNMSEKLEVLSLQVFSYWTDELSTELKIGKKEVTTRQNPLSNGFAQMEVTTSNGGTLYLGPDVFRHANTLDNDLTNIKFKADYALDDHTITFGYEYEELEIVNMFVPWSQGNAIYFSIDNFENQTPDLFIYSNSFNGTPQDAAADFALETDTIYIQDEWIVTDDLTLTFGMRYTEYTNDDDIVLNENFVERHGFANTENFDGLDLFEPRFGFNYTYSDNTIIRGGFGLFGGGTPSVWLANSYSNDGIRKPFFVIDNADNAAGLNGFDGRNIPTSVTDLLGPANAETNSISPDFEIPSTWKANLAIEHRTDIPYLGENWYLTAEAIFSEVKDAPIYRELSHEVVGNAPDGRPIFNSMGTYDLMLDSTGKGESEVYSFSAAKKWQTEYGNFDLDVGYTYQDVKEVNPGNAFIAWEGYAQPANSNFEEERLYNSEYEVPHRITANLTWDMKIFGDNKTTVALAFTARSGRHFSYTMAADGQFGGHFLFWDEYDSQLLYVPTGIDDPLVNYSSPEFAQAFNDFIDNESCLSGSRGQIAARHACESKWTSRLDLHLAQEIRFGESQLIEVYFDVENFTNMLNDDWGRAEQYPYWYVAPVVNAEIVNGQYLYSGTGNDGEFSLPAKEVSRVPSVWKAQLGIRYKF